MAVAMQRSALWDPEQATLRAASPVTEDLFHS
jgi:hypothetical protein